MDSYVFNRGWVDKDSAPSYDEIVGNQDLPVPEEEDMEEVEKAEKFEKSYNFRFEELEAANDSLAYTIAPHARTIDDSVRRKDTRRSEQRKKRQERKEQETLQKQEELKRLKNLKKGEIAEKLKKIQELSGIGDEERIAGLVDRVDLDADFDPETWDQTMHAVFDHSYYAEEEDQKPDVNVDEELVSEPSKASTSSTHERLRAKMSTLKVSSYSYDQESWGDDFCMDADYLDESQQEVDAKKGSEQPQKVDMNKYLEEYFNLDYEDMVILISEHRC